MTETDRGLSPERITVLKTAASLTPDLIEHPLIASLYAETSLTRLEIAQQVIPEVADIFPSAAIVAIGNALGKLIPKDERKRITAARRARNLRRNNEGGLGDEGFKAHQVAAAKAAGERHLKYGIDSEALTRARGLTPWIELERKFAFFLRSQPEYQYTHGSRNGHPNRVKIAEALNNVFHNGENTRSNESIGALFRKT